MRNTQTREGFEFWDKLNALPRYAFLLSPSGKSVQKFEDQAMGNWVDVHEAQKVVDQAQEAISELRDEIATSPKPDPVLCKFYDVTDWPGLVRELVGHVAQLQESAKRNVKPWEDTFPPTLLPAYVERVNAANTADQPQGEPVAWRYREGEGTQWRLTDMPPSTWYFDPRQYEVRKLYAEQPAPVAVVLPGQKAVSALVTKSARQADLINGANYYTAAEFAAEAVIDEVKRLNAKSR